MRLDPALPDLAHEAGHLVQLSLGCAVAVGSLQCPPPQLQELKLAARMPAECYASGGAFACLGI